mmetsp:Transcript_9090/g.39981  ORF Transcript_9090/g.39981 Transcript_9090/m.39981 type:complete len:428 (-) Transcript_9090:130-1413(-)
MGGVSGFVGPAGFQVSVRRDGTCARSRGGLGRLSAAVAGTGEVDNPYKITVLKGDGRGPEMAEIAVSVVEALQDYTDLHFKIDWAEFGEDSLKENGSLVPEETVEKCKQADSVLKSYQGTAKDAPVDENAHLVLRSKLDVYAQLLPTRVYPPLSSMSVFKEDKVNGVDLLLVREVSGGVLRKRETGVLPVEDVDEADSLMRYEKQQVERFANLVLDLAQRRSGRVLNVDRADQLKVSRFWRSNMHSVMENTLKDRADITVEDMFVDDFCRALVINPKKFDVVCTSNLFGDVIAELLASLHGPARINPTSWICDSGLSIHGPADLYNASAYVESADQDYSRGPISIIRAVSMMLRYGLDEPAAADLLQKALMKTFDDCVTERIASYIPEEDLNGREIVSAGTFRDYLVSNIQYMKQFEMVCDPVECGE